MMSCNKRKIVSDESEDDSFKHQRSSLQVNLSYDTDLTDSRNGSPWKTKFANGKKTNKLQANRRLLRSKNIHKKKNCQSDFKDNELRTINDTNKYAINNNEKPLHIKKEVQLKNLTINLEDISIKEKALETSCKRLKDAILFKTKEIFDEQNELSIKTAKVLESEKSHCINNIHELKDDAENKSIMLDRTNNLKNETIIKQHIMNNQQKRDGCSDIIATPTSTNRQSSRRIMNRSRLSQRQLFIETGRQKCRIIEDIVLEKKFPLLSLRQADPDNSPILSGSNRRLSLSKTKLRLQNQFENHNNSAVQCDQSVNIEGPIVCSTFIEDNEIDGKRNKAVYEVYADKDTSYTTNKAVSMEMTEINDGIQMSQVTLLQNQSPNINNYIKNDTKKDSEKEGLKQNKNAIVQRLENDIHDINKLTKNNIAYPHSINVNNIANDQDIENNIDTYTYMPMQSSIKETEIIRKSHDTLQISEHDRHDKHDKNQDERQCMILSDSNNTIRSSLNVNTSLDIPDKIKNSQESNECRILDTIQNFATNNKNFSVVLESQCKTMDSIQTSLQMNTSVDSIHKTWRRKNNYLSESSVQDKNIDDSTRNDSNINSRYLSARNKEENIDSLDNISLIERLKNISTRNQIPETSNKRKVTDTRSHNIIDIKYQNNGHINNSGDNYIESTPYPISRSILLKSQLRHKTQNSGNNEASNNDDVNAIVIEEDGDKIELNASYPKVILNKILVSNETSKTNETDVVILENIASSNLPVIQNTLIAIKDTLDETTSKEKKIITSENKEYTLSRKGRRKLLPLHESSQLCSFSPLEENEHESESSSKKNKTLKKKHTKKKSTDFKNKKKIKHDIANENTWSDSDDTFVNKKKEEKKTQKPRKVFSKKIVIKKFVEESILNILNKNEQEIQRDPTIENIDSSNDFTKHRTISTQWNRYRSQKIIIVTTGLSNGDKNLVKSIIKSLGAAEMELNVSKRTTHVISTGVRTVNLLRGIIRGCWLITLEWVLKSLENNTWLDPEEFEMKHFSKAVQENRKDRQLFGLSYIPELFITSGLIYVEHKTTIPCDTLKELIKTAGGHITENVKFAKIIVGGSGLKETWVIDSITTGELQSTKLYERK